jgi:hypothetical protein
MFLDFCRCAPNRFKSAVLVLSIQPCRQGGSARGRPRRFICSVASLQTASRALFWFEHPALMQAARRVVGLAASFVLSLRSKPLQEHCSGLSIQP